MDTTRASEGKYVNAEMVKNSPTKKLVIVDEGEFVDGTYGEKFQLTVEIDKKSKIWSPSVDNIKSLQEAYGKDSKNWIGRICGLRVLKIRGKDAVTCIPEVVGEVQI